MGYTTLGNLWAVERAGAPCRVEGGARWRVGGIARRHAPDECGRCGSSAHFRHCSSSCGGGCAPEASAVVCHKLDMYSAESISAPIEHHISPSHHSCIITSVSAGLRNTRPNARSTKIAAPSIPRAGTLPKILSPQNVLTVWPLRIGKIDRTIVRLFGYELTILTIRGGVQRRVGCHL